MKLTNKIEVVGPRSSQQNQPTRKEVGPRSSQRNQPARENRWDLNIFNKIYQQEKK